MLSDARQDFALVGANARAAPLSRVNVQLANDSPSYLLSARNFLAAGIFSQDEAPPYKIDVERTPGYPLFIAAIWTILGRQTLAPVVWVQVLLSVFAVALLYIAALRLFNRRAAAIVAALLLALDAQAAGRAAYILTDSTFQLLMVLTVYLLVDFLLTNSWRAILGLVVVVAAGFYVRPAGLLLPAALALAVLLAGPRPWPRRLAQAAVLALVPLALLFPWLLRNHSGADTWELSTIGSSNLMRYQGGAIKEILENKSNEQVYRELQQDVASRLPPDCTPGQRSAMQRQIGFAYMKQYPWLAVKTHLAGLGRLLFLPPHWVAPKPPDQPEAAPGGLLSRLVKTLKSYRPPVLLYMAYGLCSIVVLWLLALVGFFKLWRQGQACWALALVLLIAVLAAPVATPVGEPRLRMPLMVPLLLLAAAAWFSRKKSAVPGPFTAAKDAPR